MLMVDAMVKNHGSVVVMMDDVGNDNFGDNGGGNYFSDNGQWELGLQC